MAKKTARVAVAKMRSAVAGDTDVAALMPRLAMAGYTFDGKRDVFSAMGYQKVLRVADYRLRYYRNAVAARIVEAFPKASWRGGAELIEDPNDIVISTKFEKAWHEMVLRLNPWQALLRTDILAGLGTYAGMIIGAKGRSETQLPRGSRPEDLLYFASYAEDELKIESYDESTSSPRYGLPEYYLLTRVQKNRASTQPRAALAIAGQRIHHSRIIHMADGLLDDRCFGTPRLERVWNLCDDLEKVTGGGSEAFYQRANGGVHLNLDPTVVIDDEERREMEAQADEYIHGQRKIFRTRGIEVDRLGSDTAVFKQNCDAILAQISAGAGLPMRILTGSESGELASSQDRTNWNERVTDRRKEVCEPYVRQLVDRLIEFGYLPKPKQYEVDWSTEEDLTEETRTTIAARMCVANQAQAVSSGYILMTSDEIRDRYLNLPPLEDVLEADELADGGVLRLPEGHLANQPPPAPEPTGVESADESTGRTEVERKEVGSKARNRNAEERQEIDATVEALRRRREMRIVPPAGRERVKKAVRYRTRRKYARVS